MTNVFPDISHFEPDVDFHAMAAAGVPLVITKATQGTDYTDPTFTGFVDRIRTVNSEAVALWEAQAQMDIAKATAGTAIAFRSTANKYGPLVIGAYAFVMPGEAGGDVAKFESVAHLQVGDLFPVVDAEAAGLTLATVTAACGDFEAKFGGVILYCSYDYWAHTLGGVTKWALWIADYGISTAALRDRMGEAWAYVFAHQFTKAGECPGVSKPCDVSRLVGRAVFLDDYRIKALH